MGEWEGSNTKLVMCQSVLPYCPYSTSFNDNSLQEGFGQLYKRGDQRTACIGSKVTGNISEEEISLLWRDEPLHIPALWWPRPQRSRGGGASRFFLCPSDPPDPYQGGGFTFIPLGRTSTSPHIDWTSAWDRGSHLFHLHCPEWTPSPAIQPSVKHQR